MTPFVPPPGVTPGWLQLTDGANYRVGGLVYNRPLPGNGGLQVTFRQYQYGGNGADGIGFFLVDGAVDLTHAGAAGGSLGYAQRNLDPGVDGGYLGVGLDAYGNFANDGEQRGLNCPPALKSPVIGDNQVTDTVTLRGPGEDLNGYCFLASTIAPDPAKPSGYVTTLPGSLRADVTTPDTAGRTVQVTVSPDAKPLVTVAIDFGDGNGFQQVLRYQMQTAAPPTYKFGFSGSTGGLTDTHLIRNVSASSVLPLSRLNLVKTVAADRVLKRSGPYSVGDTVRYNFLATNTGDTVLSPVTVHDPLVTDIVCPETELGPVGTPTSSMVCTGTHVITVNDSFAELFHNTATAVGTSPTGTQVPSNPSTATVLVKKLTPELTLSKGASPTITAPGGVVTYTVRIANTGQLDLTPATAVDDLTGVLDDADYNGDATASTGQVTLVGKHLHWTGDLAAGGLATITYTVTVHQPDTGDLLLRNSLNTAIPGGSCGTTNPAAPSGERLSGAHQAGARMSAHARRETRASRSALPCTVDVPVIPAPTKPPTKPPTTPGPTASTHPATAAPTPGQRQNSGPSGTLATTGFAAAGLLGLASLFIATGVLLTGRRRGRHAG